MVRCESEDCVWYCNGECGCAGARIVDGECTEYGPEEEEENDG